MWTELLLTSCCATLGWVYAGFPVTLAALAARRDGGEWNTDGELKPVTVVIPAYNEVDEIAGKVENTRRLVYPEGRVSVLWVTDGSTDGTPDMLEAMGERVLHDPARGGKAAAINRAVRHVDTPWVVFTDANTHLEPSALVNVVRPLLESDVACVAGAKRVRATNGGRGESAYWRYEDVIKRLESRLHSTMGAAGELVAMRVDQFRALPTDTVLDDYVLSMRTVIDGFRTVYAPSAVATEGPSATVKGDFERRARIAAGGLQALSRLPELLAPWRVAPIVTFCHLSHRVLRWTLAPAALFALPFALTAHLAVAPSPTAAVAVALQFALLVAVGWQLRTRTRVPGLATLAHFYLANAAILAGWLRFARGRQPATWARVARAR